MGLSSPPSSPLSSIPSSPLSSLACTPEPPADFKLPLSPPSTRSPKKPNYPTPPSSQSTSNNCSPTPDGSPSNAQRPEKRREMSSPPADAPPKKRRTVSRDRPPRTTEYLDLRRKEIEPCQQEQLDRLMEVLNKRQKIVVIAGAGISVSAGIPDFRSSTGLFQRLKEEHNLKGSGKDLFDASVYKDSDSIRTFHSMVTSLYKSTKKAKATPFHRMLARIADEGRLMRLYSQNVDGLDTGLKPLRSRIPFRKGDDGKWPLTVQLHGSLEKMVCTKCHQLSNFDPQTFQQAGPLPPPCPSCLEFDEIRTVQAGKRSHGIGCLRPRMVLYNEMHPDSEAIGSCTKHDLRKRPDAVLVVGTSVKVPGVQRIVREMCATVRDRKDKSLAVWINPTPPPSTKGFDKCFDMIVQSNCDEVARRAAASRK
ncbi:DHS-like NAD/FAD-binding domain-containing protein [Piedraia hortae CBS 480.64]|uniref:DHS-like NAD/FAD-binding domain-containing protein n=1 Tax=Piedraia hortae CBS 480.64 TaxID=1314780 RepID=A0A6A7BXA7_9PEZI|nr:DHS-like NAD/FAD-binding domain-containing protein [Piedraia hortae CBS 480.64]